MDKKVTCLVCGGCLEADAGNQTVHCQKCGVVYPINVLKDSASWSEAGSSASQDVCEIEPDFEAEATKEPSAESASPSEEHEIPPLLSEWKTSYGFAALGLAAEVIMPLFLASNLVLGLVGSGIWTVLAIWYALKVYPSLFTSSPKLNSSSTASFFNMFFGGVLFGCIWNSNLANRKQGFSYLIYGIIGMFLVVAAVGLTLIYLDPFNRIGYGHVSQLKDGTKHWASDPILLEGDSQAAELVNDELCWALTRFTNLPYDTVHDYLWEDGSIVYYGQSYVDDDAAADVVREAEKRRPGFFFGEEGEECEKKRTHSLRWDVEFEFQGRNYTACIIQILPHHTASGQSLHNAEERSVWMIFIEQGYCASNAYW